MQLGILNLYWWNIICIFLILNQRVFILIYRIVRANPLSSRISRILQTRSLCRIKVTRLIKQGEKEKRLRCLVLNNATFPIALLLLSAFVSFTAKRSYKWGFDLSMSLYWKWKLWNTQLRQGRNSIRWALVHTKLWSLSQEICAVILLGNKLHIYTNLIYLSICSSPTHTIKHVSVNVTLAWCFQLFHAANNFHSLSYNCDTGVLCTQRK